MMQVAFASGNAHKVREVKQIFEANGLTGFDLLSSRDFDFSDPIEDGLTFEANALIKARALCAASGLVTIADDSGIFVDAMGGAPGIFSARWAGRHGDDQANLELLLAQLKDVPDAGRAGGFKCAAALVLPDGQEFVETGVLNGTILHEIHGENGFGYDPIVRPDGFDRSCAELSVAEKNSISHRYLAFTALAPKLKAALDLP